MEDKNGRFQFRTIGYEGFTHTIKRNGHGDYEVTWARGFPQKVGRIPSVVFTEFEVLKNIADASWKRVDDSPKADLETSYAYPDSFICGFGHENKWEMRRDKDVWFAHSLENGKRFHDQAYSKVWLDNVLASGTWKRFDQKPLTAEQRRANKEFQEQIAALESSTKISQQNVEHQLRMQASYAERIKDLKAKIVPEFGTIVEGVWCTTMKL